MFFVLCRCVPVRVHACAFVCLCVLGCMGLCTVCACIHACICMCHSIVMCAVTPWHLFPSDMPDTSLYLIIELVTPFTPNPVKLTQSSNPLLAPHIEILTLNTGVHPNMQSLSWSALAAGQDSASAPRVTCHVPARVSQQLLTSLTTATGGAVFSFHSKLFYFLT